MSAMIADRRETLAELRKTVSSMMGEEKAASAKKPLSRAAAEGEAQARSAWEGEGRMVASPLAKRIAENKNIDLRSIIGTGPGGRIIKKDVEEYVPAAKPAIAAEAAPAPVAAAAPAEAKAPAAAPAPVQLPTFTGEEKFTERNVTQMRKAISRRLSERRIRAA